MSENIVQVAVLKAGGAITVAKKAKIRRTSVYKWIYSQVPAERVAMLSELSGIPCHEIRPDIFPKSNRSVEL